VTMKSTDPFKHNGYENLTLYDRFMEKVEIDPVSGCWNWKGRTTRSYGQIRTGKTMTRAHRASWLLFRGKIDNDLYVCHKCDNTLCVNPDHLFLGTQTDNMQDMMSKGRGRKATGTSHPNAKLSDDKVKEIFDLFDSGVTRKEIAAKFGVSYSLIKQLIRGELWKHVNISV
jgi:hypothetical protein